MSEIKVENVETLTQVSSVVASATNNDKILTTESQVRIFVFLFKTLLLL